MSTKSIDQILVAVTAWLEPSQGERARAALRGWEADDWRLAQQVIFMHWIGPSLRQSSAAAPGLSEVIPAAFQEYLETQSAWNTARIRQVHARLGAILVKANQLGIEVMPLKGCLLSTQEHTGPQLRVMADIDLLIRPADRQAMGRVLEQLGYQLEQSKSFYIHNDHYNHQQDRVVSWEGEHPENPIPVDVHTNMRRILWGDTFTPDFTQMLWDSSQPGEILGERVLIPGNAAHYAYLSLHALVHLLAYKGRLAQWLDLARLAAGIPDFSRLPDAGLLYPLVRLAARALPEAFANVDLSLMAAQAQPAARNWAEQVPLNSRCGLINQRSARPLPWLIERYAYWRPTPIRLAMAYPDTPLPAASLRLLAKLGQYLLRGRKNPLPDKVTSPQEPAAAETNDLQHSNNL